MAIHLKPVDVAVVGLGAAGGVAELPLARAGLKIAGLEAGTWMDPHRDFHADEVYNNVRRLVSSSPKAQRECPTVRDDAFAAGSIGRGASDDERHRRDVDPLLGAELASEALGFSHTLRIRPALRS